jgi:hypothetical protein
MEVVEVYRDHDEQYFDEMLKNHGYGKFTPSGFIVDKKFPNIGATTVEIESERHSIIMEPFKAVIEVKKKIYGSLICCVYNGITTNDVYNYLISNIQYKKIITTPESFYKVIKALKKYDEDYHQNFFMLIDECEKLIQDCLFRSKILAPLKEFFRFEHKSLISATPIRPSAPEFRDFNLMRVVPGYNNYKKPLVLLITNNIRTAIRSTIKIKTDGAPIFIFSNCKQTLAYIARLDEVQNRYTIFCAEDLERKFFSVQDIGNVINTVLEQDYSEVNMFTSRFFSAVDMHLPEGVIPHVLIITNIPQTRHSLIEPSIDAVQIYGRSRNGVKSITHITNLFSEQQGSTAITVRQDALEEITLVDSLNKLRKKSQYDCLKDSVDSIRDKQFASNVFNEDGTINEYYKDNFLSKRLLKFHYTNAHLLYNEYAKVDFFKTIKHVIKDPISDLDRLKLRRGLSKAKRRYLALLLDRTILAYHSGENNWNGRDFGDALNAIRAEDELTYEVYKNYGSEFLNQINYNKSAMMDAIFELEKQDGTNKLLMMDKIIATFSLNIPYHCYKAKEILQNIYDDFRYRETTGKIKVAKGTDLELYFEFKNGRTKEKVDGKYREFYVLLRPLYKLSNKLKYLGSDKYY